MKILIYLVLIVTCVSSNPPPPPPLNFGQEEYHETVGRTCCRIGENHPKNVGCSDEFINPFSGGHMSDFCQQSFDQCCSRKRADEICSRGIQAAKDHGDCMLLTEDTRFGLQIIRSCCQGCEAGVHHSCSAISVGFGFNANPDADRGFLACCHKETAAVFHPLSASPEVQPVFHERRNLKTSNGKSEATGGLPLVIPMIPTETKPQEEEVNVNQVDETPRDEPHDKKLGVSMSGQKHDPQDLPLEPSSCPTQCKQTCITDEDGQKQCSCFNGFVLADDDFSCEDVNECQEGKHNCSDNFRCKNTEGSFQCIEEHQLITAESGSAEVIADQNKTCEGQNESWDQQTGHCIVVTIVDNPESCEAGFEFIKGSCVDIDECAFDGNDCKLNGMLCINTPGSSECQAHDSADGSDGNPSGIIEVDPDLGPEVDSGLTAEVDPDLTPEDEVERCKDPKGIESCGCFEDEICAVNNEGGCSCEKFSCPDGKKVQDTRCVPLSTPDTCKTGTTRHDNGTCIDINECLSNPCPEGENCFNNEGSFTCVKECEPGSRVDNRWFVPKCNDIDECSEKTHNCSDTQICTNLDPWFTCDCKVGYLLNQETGLCEDVDECSDGRKCNPDSSYCENTIGSYECICKTGYRKNNYGSCDDINECSEVLHDCPELSVCTNTIGSWKCRCPTGFEEGFNNTCVLPTVEKTCHGLILNGKCTCPEGFSLITELAQQYCHDIDECFSGDHSCGTEAVCINTIGTYKCMKVNCPASYHKSPLEEYKNFCFHEKFDKKCLEEPSKCVKSFNEPATIAFESVVMYSNISTEHQENILYSVEGLTGRAETFQFFVKDFEAKAEEGVKVAQRDDFKMEREYNKVNNAAHLNLVNRIFGPQDIFMDIDVFENSTLSSLGVIHRTVLHVYVSKFNPNKDFNNPL